MGVKHLFVILLILLAACEPALRTVPTSEHQAVAEQANIEQEKDLCANINCTIGFCQAGVCTCGTGKKLCNNKCIDEETCCTNEDCDTGNCEEGVCQEPKECNFGEELKKGECRCASDKIYCEEQKRCIDRDGCCIHTQCNKFERCAPTNLRTSLCIKIEEKKLCKIVSDLGRTELYEIKEHEFNVKAAEWLNDRSITFDFDNQSIRIAENATVTYEPANATLFHEGIEVVGGYCKEDED